MKINYFDLGVCYGREIGIMEEKILPFLKIEEYKIFGFEPCQGCFDNLNKRYKNNNVSLIKAAISNHNGRSYLYHSFKSGGKYTPIGNSLFATKYNVKEDDYEEVDCILFSEWLLKNVPTYKEDFNIIRTNIEGAEWHLFNDLKNNNLFKYINIFCGSNPEEEMAKVKELEGNIPDLNYMFEKYNIKVHTFADLPHVDRMIRTINDELPEENRKVMPNKKAIYLVILGGYDELREPEVITSGWDYICFTNNEKLKSDVWQMRKLEIDPFLSNAKLSRKVVTLFHKYLPEYDITIKTDGYTTIKCDLNEFIEKYFLGKGFPISVLQHPSRNTIYGEADSFIREGREPCGVVKRQIDCYEKDGIPNNVRCGANTIIIRKSGVKELERFCELWWDEILRHSARDQISFIYTLWKNSGIVKVQWLPWKIFVDLFWDCSVHHIPLPDIEAKRKNPIILKGLKKLCKYINSPESVLIEVGSYLGQSTVIPALYFKQVYAINTWDGIRDIERNFDWIRNKTNNIVKFRQDYKEALCEFSDGSADIVYINMMDNIEDKIKLWLPKIRNKGYISGERYFDFKSIIDNLIGIPDKVFYNNVWIKKKENKNGEK